MRIDVLEYATLENYLADFVEKSRSERPTWSISGWAKRLGLKSTTSISKIICGQRTCGPVVSAALVKYFNFTEIEKRHFQYLIEKTKLAQDHPTRGLIETEILTGVKSRKTIILTEIQMSEVRNWYFLAIRLAIFDNAFVGAKPTQTGIPTHFCIFDFIFSP